MSTHADPAGVQQAMRRQPDAAPLGSQRRSRKRPRIAIGMAGLLTLLATCTDTPLEPVGHAALDPAFAAGGTAAVPFRGFLEGHDLSVTPQADGIRYVAIMTGSVSGLGKVAQILDYILEYDLVHFAGTATITAANGDQLFLDFTGAAPGFAEQEFPALYTADFAITGGTGRLAGNAGGGRIEGFGYGDGTFDGRYDGTRILGTEH